MKVTSLLARLSLIAVLASLAGLAFNAAALALFAGSAAAFVLLIATSDYRPVARATADVAVMPQSRSPLPLAA